MENFRYLNLKFNPVREDFVYPNLKENSSGWDLHMLDPENIFSTDCLEFFKSLGLKLYRCQFFRGERSHASGIHIDGHDSFRPLWAINWVMNSRDSEMVWYRQTGPGKETYTPAGTAYKTFKLDEVEHVETLKFNQDKQGPVLVRTDIPHRAINNDTENIRWCVSLRAETNFKEWQQVVDFFNPYISQ